MRLKSLELVGFKSFRDRTEFTFDGGVTAIVGPNGCGKSNVVDAMKWILGEQRPTSLRSSEMQEVIYNGTDGGPNFAQASITIANDRNVLPVDYEEVCITRRLHRTGESEYLINKSPCRLRDIRELFMGTGLGVGSYFVMEQGRIDAILESRPEERRQVFDEAAGISLFKARKKESLRKLEKVDENLVRLNDIHEEVTKQIHSVKIQAGRARRYQELSQELKQKRVAFSLERFHCLEVRRCEIAAERAALGGSAERLREELSRAEAAVAECQSALRGRQQEIARVSAERERAEGERERATERHRFCAELLADLENRRSAEEGAARDVEARIAETRRALEEGADRRERIERDVERHVAAFEAGRERLRTEEAEASARRADVERIRAAGAELLRERTDLQGRLADLEAQRRSLGVRGDRLAARRVEISADLSAIEEGLAGLQVREAEAGRAGAEAVAALDEARRAREAEQAALDALRDAQNAERERHARKKARFEVLDGIDRRREGVATGPRAILEESARAETAIRGVLGLAADALVSDVAHGRAVEAALAERAQCLVVEDDAAALAAIDFARGRAQGAVAALALSSPAPAARLDSPPALPGGEGAIAGRATDVIVERLRSHPPAGFTAEQLERIADRLLGDVLFVRDRVSALALREWAREARARLVTLEGEVFEPWGGVLCGGALHSTGLISRKSELRSLAAELERLDLDLGRRATELEASQARLGALEETVRRLEEELRAAERRRESLAAERAQAEDRLSYLRRDLNATEAEWREVTGALVSLEDREADSRAGIAAAEARLAAADRDLEAAEAALGGADEARLEASGALGDLKAAVAEAQARRDAIAASIEREAQALREAEERLQATARTIEDLRARHARTAGEIQDLAESVCRLAEKAEGLRGRDEDARAAEGRAREDLERAEATVRARRGDVEEVREAERRLELQENEQTLHQKNLEERVLEDLGLVLRELHASYDPAPLDADALGREIEDLKGKIERLGNVNLDAIQELHSLEEREAFLRAQRDDLVKSKESLREVIRRIDQTCQERFEASFREVRTHFREVFRKLFGGGTADVFLVDEQNPLESGVEITAKPPGKELVTIQLLSGGEKSMTAVALLFAIFRSRPSPFCVLDEVDAALDDANIQRFVTMVREFVSESQFIIITHSKKTMSAADLLYGITMEQSSVSKKVAVRFRNEENGRGPGRGSDAALETEEPQASEAEEVGSTSVG